MLIAHQKYLLPVSRHVALIVWPCSTKCHLKSTVSGILYFLFSTFLMSLTLGSFLFVSVCGFKIHLYDIDKKRKHYLFYHLKTSSLTSDIINVYESCQEHTVFLIFAYTMIQMK